MSEPARPLVLALVSHTNVGKTTLARTLLRRDVGEVFDHAHVTDETELHALLETPTGERVVLSDTPGFGDSARLLGRLRGRDDPLGWLLGQVWDRFADRALWCSQQAVAHVREAADVVLYLVNASEDPTLAGYVEPELEILDWIGHPVVVLLNQVGELAGATARAADEARWREHVAAHATIRDVLHLDAFARCWVQESTLLERIRDALPEARRPLADTLLAHWRETNLGALRDSIEVMAHHLGAAAADREALGEARFGALERRRGAETLAQRHEERIAETSDRLIALHGLAGEAAEELRVRLEDVKLPGGLPDPWRRGALGGLVGGALGGLTADVAVGGLSFGGGTVAGALLGAAGAGGLAWAVNQIGSGGPPRVAWTLDFLDRQVDEVLLRYLEVAHFGRGGGEFRRREPPERWRAAVERALEPFRRDLRSLWRETQADESDSADTEAGLELVPPLTQAVRAVLVDLHPDCRSWLLPARERSRIQL